jgi:hypothetical protein
MQSASFIGGRSFFWLNTPRRVAQEQQALLALLFHRRLKPVKQTPQALQVSSATMFN